MLFFITITAFVAVSDIDAITFVIGVVWWSLNVCDHAVAIARIC